ncbi:Poly(A) polymerase central domain-containing protein [Phycomyces nitens]|nr:Poly(A) polymerase central domain-containing protein [Phycomyces nitens]
MSSTKPTYLGVSEPISIAPPSANDEQLNEKLEATLKDHNMYETKEKTLLRKNVLEILEKLTKQMVATVYRKKGLSQSETLTAGGTIRTFGSYKLGVHAADADIDTVCIIPRHVSTTDFFDEWCAMLQVQPGVKDVSAVKDSYVPVIKFKIYGISASHQNCIENSVVPNDIDVNSTAILQSLSEKSLRSINGTRVADEILTLVPDVTAFRTALRCIKLWATKRAIYSNSLGFFGGVAWALLVARICQLYPNACASTIVSKFFMVVAQWAWPSPVVLKAIEGGRGFSSLKPWNPKLSHNDRSHLMPIITPAYPNMCATHNVSQSTKTIILGELKRAAAIVDRIMIGSSSWNVLFTEHNFFGTYDHYIQVVASSDTYDCQLKWSGLVEARLRHLLLNLDSTEGVALAHPFVHGFDKAHVCQTTESLAAVINGIETNGYPITSENSDSWKNKTEAVFTRTFYVGLYMKLDPGKQLHLNIIGDEAFSTTAMVFV